MLLVGVEVGTTPLESSPAAPRKSEHISYNQKLQSLDEISAKRRVKNIAWSTICNNPKPEVTTCPPTVRWMNNVCSQEATLTEWRERPYYNHVERYSASPNIMLRTRSRHKRVHAPWLHFYEIRKQATRIVVSQGRRAARSLLELRENRLRGARGGPQEVLTKVLAT